MKRLLLSTLLALSYACAPLRADDPPKGFESLFNGKDLTGWKSTGDMKVWGAENGVIFCKGSGGGWLMTEKQYGDFELRLEYKMPAKGNSGVGIRSPLQGDPAYAGMELQLIDDIGWPGKLANWQNTGSIYNVVPAKKIANKPIGEWNSFKVIANGRKVKVEQNGEVLVDANLDDYVKEHGKRHPGISRDKGHVGFQSYNARVEFRNIFLKPLTKDAPPAQTEEKTPASQDKDRRLTAAPKHYDLKYHPWTPPATKAGWDTRRPIVKEQLLVSQGLWPLPEKAPLNPVIHSKVERDGYTIEKVYFASHPGHYVTGNLYRPIGRTGKLPAVLYTHGHWKDARLSTNAGWEKEMKIGAEQTENSAKYFHQAGCAMLARMGCVVFHYDMVGNSDSLQIPHREGFKDVDAQLRLQTFMGLQTWNSIRVLDFLHTIPEVDTARIGITGASGGGTQSFVLAAVDERVAAAFPAVMVSASMQGGCICENCAYMRVGTTNIELSALIAPRPLGMTGANDWTREIETKGLPELKTIYSMYGVRDNVMAKYLSFEHNYNQVSREVMYNFFKKHLGFEGEKATALAGGAGTKLPDAAPASQVTQPERRLELVRVDTLVYGPFGRRARIVSHWEYREVVAPAPAAPVAPAKPIVEKPFNPVPPKALSVYDAEHPVPADAANAETLKKTLTQAQESQLANLRPTDQASLGRFQKIEHGALRAMMVDQLPAGSDVEVVSKGALIEKDGIQARALTLSRKGQGERVKALIVHGKDFNGKGIIWVHPNGIASLWKDGKLVPAAKAAVDKGAGIMALEVFRTGEAAQEARPTTNMKVSSLAYAGYFYGYNRALVAERVHDILTAVAFARSNDKVKSLSLVGFDKAGPWVVLARGLCGTAVERTAADLNGFRFEQVKDFDDEMMLPGALKYGGLVTLASVIAPHDLYLHNAKGTGSSAFLEASYKAAGQPQRAQRVEARSDAATVMNWVLR